MYKLIGFAAFPVSMTLRTVSVHASSEEDKQDKEVLTLDKLSLYSEPVIKYEYKEKEPDQLEESISWLRQSVDPYTTWCKSTYAKVKPSIENIVQIGNDNYKILKDPPAGFYPRMGVIGFAGIAGLFLARGSKLKRMVYPVGLMTIAASLYYPQQAVNVAKTTQSRLYEWGIQSYVSLETLWKDSSNKKKPKKGKAEKVSEKPGDETEAAVPENPAGASK
ncbi:MICOS complex subunit MIC26 [Protopterus annectens]|uniref:MICOS complex subunit MIC26 n=1 Tax=Protopterus annectens TaxID=7888 RepID=UPI001CFA6EF3|nr:MICOS complex subunit MIC26 [Protopterus annectens]